MENYNNQKPYSGQNTPAYGNDTNSTVVLGAENGNSRYGSNPTYRDYVNSQQPPYGGQPPYGMQPPYGGQPPFGMQPPYGGQPPYGMQPPYGGQPPYGMQPQINGTKCLTFGILGSALYLFPILGLVFAIVGLVSSTNAKKASRALGIRVNGKIIAGNICSAIGLGFNCFSNFYYFIIFCIAVSH